MQCNFHVPFKERYDDRDYACEYNWATDSQKPVDFGTNYVGFGLEALRQPSGSGKFFEDVHLNQLVFTFPKY